MTDKTAPEMGYEEATRRCPMSFLRESRQDAPVLKLVSPVPDMNGYLITRREDVLAIAQDTETYSSVGNPQGKRWNTYNDEAAEIYRKEGMPLCPVLVWIDPPDHARFRKLVDRVFRPKRVAERSGHIQVCIDKLMANFATGGSLEAMGEFALKLPAMVMTREFGASEDDYNLLIATTNAVGGSVDFTRATEPAEVAEIVRQAAHAVTAFQKYMTPRVERVRHTPEDNLLSELVNAMIGDEPALSTQEIMSLLVVFLIAATHSTTGAIGWALHTLAREPKVQAELREKPEKIEAFIEEVLRMNGTVSTSFRTTTREVELHGVTLPKEAQVFIRWDSANFDETSWERPEEFDMDRPNLRGHTTFGVGPHYCVGNTLARREMLQTIQEFLKRFSRIEFDTTAGEPEQVSSFNVHVLQTLPLRLTV